MRALLSYLLYSVKICLFHIQCWTKLVWVHDFVQVWHFGLTVYLSFYTPAVEWTAARLLLVPYCSEQLTLVRPCCLLLCSQVLGVSHESSSHQILLLPPEKPPMQTYLTLSGIDKRICFPSGGWQKPLKSRETLEPVVSSTLMSRTKTLCPLPAAAWLRPTNC